ncbi:type VI secretion protein [Geomonas limicola]|uniref:Type VI secretion protein n=1 Tax=Geomonas limicola TaxID=2740186 RepID=A0A6V8NEH9_9BACT|nr:type VI secretion system baseplate subunit TssG [Geomonas limicola]GFO69529.1 type VI secretion protein [Geomonas limicola]
MDTAARGSTTSLADELVRKGDEFSFVQAMRLLEGRSPGRIRIRPVLGLGFAGSDVVRIAQDRDGYRVVISFLGLYGTGAPLPTFYTEELIEERLSELSVRRDFLDIFNQRIGELCYQCLAKYRLFLPEVRDVFRERLFCLMGWGGRAQRRPLEEPGLLPRFAGVVGMRCHGALGLATLLKGVLRVPVRILQCLERRTGIPENRRAVLGSGRLGSAFAGSSLPDRNGKFAIRLGPLDAGSFASFLPEGSGRRRIEELVESYLRAPLRWDLQLLLAAPEVPAARLGCTPGGRVGYDSWLGRKTMTTAMVTFSSCGLPQGFGRRTPG